MGGWRVNLRNGFTLIELVLVLAISAVLAAIAMPRYASSLNRYRVDGAAKRLAADMVLAQATAKGSSSTCTVVFRVKPDTYDIQGMAAPDGRAGGYRVTLSGEPYGVRLDDVKFSDNVADDTLTFSGYGLPDSGADITLSVGGLGRTVKVDAATGAVTVQ